MINAHEYRRRAHQWRQDINTIAAAADDITRLQRQLNSARQSLAACCAPPTPCAKARACASVRAAAATPKTTPRPLPARSSNG